MFLEFLEIARCVPEGFFDKGCVLIFVPQNRVRSMFFEFLYIVEGGELLDVFLRAYFDFF